MNNLLPAHARVWVYQSTRPFTESECTLITEKTKQFVRQWTSHREQVTGDGFLLYNRFIVLMADEDQVALGGCSVDSSVHFVKMLGNEFNANFFDRWTIAYIKDGEVCSSAMPEFEKQVANGEIKDETIVFNNLVQNKRDFETNWKIPYSKSWLKKLAGSHTPFSSVL